MKKKLLLLGTIGAAAAAGVWYALGSSRTQNREADFSGKRKASGATAGDGVGTAAQSQDQEQHVIDDHGTDQLAASQILRNIRDNAFDASDEKLALALGRPTEEIEEWTNGNGLIDGDVVMKARVLANQRGVQAE